MWESWQCVLPNGRASSLSRNHYAFGCVGDWIYRRLGGIQALEPGYKWILFAPDFDSPLQWGKAAHLCDYGWIRCEWEKREDSIQHQTEGDPRLNRISSQQEGRRKAGASKNLRPLVVLLSRSRRPII